MKLRFEKEMWVTEENADKNKKRKRSASSALKMESAGRVEMTQATCQLVSLYRCPRNVQCLEGCVVNVKC